MNEVYIFHGIRTPIGRHGGALARVRTDELLAGCIREVVNRAGIDGSLVEDVIAGDTNQAGVPMNSHGCAPRSKPNLNSGIRQ